MALEDGGDGVDFDTWISDRFRALNTDEAVFAPYIKSIVEGDETEEEKIDALDGILAELATGEFDVEAFRKEILRRWDSELKKALEANGATPSEESILNSKLESILKINDAPREEAKSTDEGGGDKGSKSLSHAPDSALRAAILNQYRDDSDEDVDAEGASGSAPKAAKSGGGEGELSGWEKNTNLERVLNDGKERREREKAEAAKKREKDREDRAKQKQQAQERKDKAKKKTAKVERKR